MYTTKSGDTWDAIAKEIYGSDYAADLLMEANPEKIGTFVFASGVTLETPEQKQQQSGLLPPWKYKEAT